MKKTSEYYRDSAMYWLKKMVVDVEHGDWSALRLHYKDLGEALSLVKSGRKNGD